jgi:hypothetical protein
MTIDPKIEGRLAFLGGVASLWLDLGGDCSQASDFCLLERQKLKRLFEALFRGWAAHVTARDYSRLAAWDVVWRIARVVRVVPISHVPRVVAVCAIEGRYAETLQDGCDRHGRAASGTRSDAICRRHLRILQYSIWCAVSERTIGISRYLVRFFRIGYRLLPANRGRGAGASDTGLAA